MGLDVYLYKYPDAEKFEDEKKYSRLVDRLYNEYTKDAKFDELPKKTQHEYEDKLKKAAKAFGLDPDGECKDKEQIHIDSTKHPEHYYKIGYFRSSYNGGGTNTVLGNAIGKDLYYVFQPNDEYLFRPIWNDCLLRAKTLQKEFKEFTEKYSFGIEQVFHSQGHGPTSSQEARKTLISEITNSKKDKMLSGAYSNANGNFYLKEPEKVIAIMTGTMTLLGNEPIPCTYVAFKEDYKWYIEAIEIVIDAIEYVINTSEPEKYVLAWSA